MIRLVVLGLALYGLYMLFFSDKKIVIENRSQKPGMGKKEYTDYEEIDPK